jgi:hypothetical protein
MVVLVVLLWGGEVLAGSGETERSTGEQGSTFPFHYRGLSIAGHVLGWSSFVFMFPAPFLFHGFIVYDIDSTPEKQSPLGYNGFFSSYMTFLTVGATSFIVGMPLMMAAQHRARARFRENGLLDSRTDLRASRLEGASWAFYVLAMHMFVVDEVLAGPFPFPLSSTLILVAMSLAQATWATVDKVGRSTEHPAVSIAPWLSGIPGGFMVGLGGRF